MIDVTVEILVILFLIVLNGVFAMAEMAIVASRKVRLRQRAEDGDHRAQVALHLAENPDRFLATVQVGITLIGILTGAFGGVTLAEKLSGELSKNPALAPYSTAIGIATVVTVITFLSLLFGELIPKRLALNSPESIARVVARPMNLFSKIGSPIVKLLSGATALFFRLSGIQQTRGPEVTEEEIEVLLAQGAEAGILEEAEHDILERVLRFADETIAAFMTPRREVVCLDVDDTPEDTYKKIFEEPYSFFVLCRGSLDHPLGVIDTRGLLVQCLEGKPIDIMSASRQPLFVPESVPALQVLDRFRRTGEHIALVVNEYGGIEGVASMTDITEALVGQLPLPGEPFEPGFILRDDGSWLVDGMISIDEFKDHFDLRILPGEDSGHFRTVGGFVVNFLGEIPRPSDSFDFDNLHVEVMDMDGNRVDKVLVIANPREEESTTGNE